MVNKDKREARKKKIRSVNQVELMSRSSLQVELMSRSSVSITIFFNRPLAHSRSDSEIICVYTLLFPLQRANGALSSKGNRKDNKFELVFENL